MHANFALVAPASASSHPRLSCSLSVSELERMAAGASSSPVPPKLPGAQSAARRVIHPPIDSPTIALLLLEFALSTALLIVLVPILLHRPIVLFSVLH